MFQAKMIDQNWAISLPKYWNDNSPFKTHFLNALSITLPDCEKFFISTVTSYSKNLSDSNQLIEVKEFIKQESQHRHAHKKYNQWLSNQGLPVNQLQKIQIAIWNLIKKYTNSSTQLAVTISIEHITVVYAAVLLSHHQLINAMHPHFKQIWKWHAIEEIEHKAVAMDIWNNFERNNFQKNLIMMIVLPSYMFIVGVITLIFLYSDKQLFKLKTFNDGINFLFNKNSGLLSKSIVPWFQFMSNDFHPNNQDHINIIQEYIK